MPFAVRLKKVLFRSRALIDGRNPFFFIFTASGKGKVDIQQTESNLPVNLLLLVTFLFLPFCQEGEMYIVWAYHDDTEDFLDGKHSKSGGL